MAFVLAFGLTAAPISVQPALANSGTIYVSGTGSDSGDGTVENPYREIQEGIDKAQSDATIDTIMVAAGTYKEIVLKSDVDIISDRSGDAIISSTSGSAVIANAKTNVKLDGFTITNGKAQIIGAGIAIQSGSRVTISNCLIIDNAAGGLGGGVSVRNSSAEIINCTIVDNIANKISGVVFGDGGGIYISGSTVNIFNSIIAQNEAKNVGGGIHVVGSSTVTMSYNDVWGNIAADSGTEDYSEISDQTGSNGNIGADPLFVGSGDYHLQSGSPCIDAGDNAFWDPTDLDLDGLLRIHNGVVDMGVYEYGSGPPSSDDTQPPTASNPDPTDGSYTADSTPDISVELTDYDSGVDPASIALTVAGDTVAHSWDGSTVSYTPPTPFTDGQVVDVTVDANDNVGNAMAQYSWSFTISLEYTLTINTVGSGTVDLDPEGPTYSSGTQVTLTADPDPGWAFTGWSGDITSSDNPLTITMDSAKTVTATFSQDQYTLTINTVGNGTVDLDPEGPTYSSGTQVTLTADPDPGWSFAGWSGDLTGTENPKTITMNSDKTVTVTFTKDKYTLTIDVAPSGGGTVNAIPAGTYHYDDVVELTAVPSDGYIFDHWSGDLSGSVNPASITMDGNKSVTAYFTQDEYTLTVDTVGNGSVAKNPNKSTYTHGETVELTATADPGSFFDFWSVGLAGNTNPDTITMDGDKNVTAVFTAAATTPMAEFNVTHAKIDCEKKSDDGKVRVQGELALDLTHGDDVDISETVTVIIGPLNETVTMVEKGKKGEKWEYKRPKDGDGILKKMSIDWKEGKFDFEMDEVDLCGFTRPVSISLQIGNDIGQATVLTSKITEVTIDSKKKDDDGKVRVEGELGFGLVCGPYDSPTDDIVVGVGSLFWTLPQDDIEVKGKEGESWEYKPPKDSDTAFRHAQVDWKKGSFDFDLDGVDLSSLDLTQPVEISVTIEGETICETIQLTQKGKKDAKWEYKS